MKTMLYANYGYETTTIFYVEEENMFIDEQGFPLFDMFRIMTPNQLYLFKKLKEPFSVRDQESKIIYNFVYGFADGGPLLLFYDEKTNIFYDESGFIIFAIFGIVSPNQVLVFKHKRRSMTVRGTHGDLVKLVWPNTKI